MKLISCILENEQYIAYSRLVYDLILYHCEENIIHTNKNFFTKPWIASPSALSISHFSVKIDKIHA